MSQFTRRQFVAGSSLLAGSLVLTACGGGNDAQTTNTTSTSESATTAVDGDLGLVTDGTLTVVSELGFAPFEYIEEGETDPVGFDVDVSKAIGEKLGLEVKWLPNQSFDTLVPTIKEGGKADIAIAGITITDERAAEIDFTAPYLDSNQAVVVKADSTETLETLDAEGKKIAVQSGTTGNDWVVENLPNATCVPLADVTAAEMGVQTGSYDAFVIDLPVASNDIKNSFADLKVLEEIPTGEQYGIVVSQDNLALLAAVDGALADMEEDGTMDDIKVKWFGSAI